MPLRRQRGPCFSADTACHKDLVAARRASCTIDCWADAHMNTPEAMLSVILKCALHVSSKEEAYQAGMRSTNLHGEVELCVDDWTAVRVKELTVTRWNGGVR